MHRSGLKPTLAAGSLFTLIVVAGCTQTSFNWGDLPQTSETSDCAGTDFPLPTVCGWATAVGAIVLAEVVGITSQSIPMEFAASGGPIVVWEEEEAATCPSSLPGVVFDLEVVDVLRDNTGQVELGDAIPVHIGRRVVSAWDSIPGDWEEDGTVGTWHGPNAIDAGDVLGFSLTRDDSGDWTAGVDPLFTEKDGVIKFQDTDNERCGSYVGSAAQDLGTVNAEGLKSAVAGCSSSDVSTDEAATQESLHASLKPPVSQGSICLYEYGATAP